MYSTEVGLSYNLSTQFDLDAEVETYQKNPKAARTDILWHFGEFFAKVPLAQYSYRQIDANTLISPGLEQDGDVSIMARRGVREESKRSWFEYLGFLKMRQLILESHEPTWVIWVSPPGPKAENYGGYGFVYVGFVPQGIPGKQKDINMFALKIDDCNAKKTEASLEMLKRLSPEAVFPGKTTEDKLLLNPIHIPMEGQFGEAEILPLFQYICAFLGIKMDKQKLEAGLTNKLLEQASKQYAPQILQILLALRKINNGKGISESDHRLLLNIAEQSLTGNCPAKNSTGIESLSTKKKEGDLHICPECGMLFSGPVCHYCNFRLAEQTIYEAKEK